MRRMVMMTDDAMTAIVGLFDEGVAKMARWQLATCSSLQQHSKASSQNTLREEGDLDRARKPSGEAREQ
ncbi:hypothetical protein Dda_2207 [Drechslerella dactyloides]|uniref:Uncharacterized protein n=1 Tax=Drechslerella dactyloides TaxID=74499 RepID=A0AAD6J333_DREDA|nr:hypothetical protein Dda_2207 [Drechslerella dactyloides]